MQIDKTLQKLVQSYDISKATGVENRNAKNNRNLSMKFLHCI